MLEGNQMVIAWPPLWWKDRNWLEKLWLIAAGIAAIYYGAIQPRQDFRGIAESKATALAAIEDSRHQHWFQPNSLAVREELQTEGIVGGVPANAAYQTSVVTRLAEEDERKIVRTSSIALIVEKPADAAGKIQQLAEGAGGFLMNWEANAAQEATSASLMIRVPVSKFESTRTAIRSLAQRVENERVEAKDASTQYVDDQSRLRNLRAQETQYLVILRQARTVKDTLEVSDKLNQVRGEIDRQQSEFNTLSKQVELVAITISLRKETEAQVFGLPWRPLYEVKLAARMGLEGLIDYSTSILSFFFYLPAILLWMATILAGAAIGWRVLRWAGRQLFVARASTANR
jgi:Domain of unknown function (DUF4349)